MGLLRTNKVWRWTGVGVVLVSLVGLASCAGSNPTGNDTGSSPARTSGPSAAEAAGEKAQNPIPRNGRSVNLGHALYTKQCQSCHGPRGRGDGPAVGRLNVSVPDLTDADVQGESDGELFTVITKGSKPMPAYRKLLNEEQRWHVVNYLRASFGRQAGPA